jgi:hypothetical protein
VAGKIWKTTATSPDRRFRRTDRAKLEWTRVALPAGRAAEVEAIAARQGKSIHQVLLEGLELWLEKNRPAALPEPEPAPSSRWLAPSRRPRLPFRGAGPQKAS